jgi:8-oxo-dGTP diphosphatase
MTAPVEVAVAVLIRQDGRVLLAKRPAGKVYAGWWEFPGGKVEEGEAVAHALARELGEELGLARIDRAYPWITQLFTYPHADVRLHFFRVRAWSGEPRALEHEGLSWERPDTVRVAPMLPANSPVLRALALSDEYAITQAGELGVDASIAALRRRLDAGLRLVQVREPGFSSVQRERFAAKVVALARPAGARVVINSDAALAAAIGADGVHLSARQVAAARERPELPLVGASAHSAGEIRAAQRIGADFAVLGPVRSTPSHPDRAPLGWDGFRESARGAAIPVFALGGVGPGDMETAWACGAHGVAMVRAAWRP